MAIEDLPFRENIYIKLKSYELDPKAEKNVSYDIYESLANKYKITVEEAKKMNDQIKKQGAEVGLQLNFDRIKQTNTFDAHRLIKFAEKHSKEIDLEQRLFQAYFTNGINISDHDELAKMAEEVGLNKKKVKEILQTCKYTNIVKEDEELAIEMGVRAVPFFVFNEKYALSGAQPIEVFKEVMTKVWEEEAKDPNNDFSVKKSQNTYCCDGDHCQRTNE